MKHVKQFRYYDDADNNKQNFPLSGPEMISTRALVDNDYFS
jgi:hypothetical protein